jgi:hypothetical protein
MATKLQQHIDAIHAQLADASVLSQFGRVKLQENTQQRRVVWVRTQSQVEPPKSVGGRLDGAGNRLRQVYRRAEGVYAYVFAEDETTTELLLDGLLAAIHLTCGPNAMPGSYEWEMEAPGRADIALRQPKIRLELVLYIPVFDEAAVLQSLTKQGVVGSFAGVQIESIIQP